ICVVVSSPPAPPHRFLPAVYDADAFRASAESTRVEVHVQFACKALQFAHQDSLWVAHVGVEGVLYNSDLRAVGRDEYESTVTARKQETTTSDVLWPAQLAFEAAQGDCRLALRIRDTSDGGTGTYVADVRVPAFKGLAISDLGLATWVEARPELSSSRFAKGTQVVMPNPASVYRRGAPLTAYFETYGLATDARGRSRYEMTYTVHS